MAFSSLEATLVKQSLDAFLARIRPPESIRPKLDFGYRLSRQSIELFQVRPAWRGGPGETMETPVAKTTYVRRHDHWRIYWMRRDLKWHLHPLHDTADTFDEVLALVEQDEGACFFG